MPDTRDIASLLFLYFHFYAYRETHIRVEQLNEKNQHVIESFFYFTEL